MLAPDMPGRTLCVRCGCSRRARAFERRPCVPPAVFPARAAAAVRAEVYTGTATSATPGPSWSVPWAMSAMARSRGARCAPLPPTPPHSPPPPAGVRRACAGRCASAGRPRPPAVRGRYGVLTSSEFGARVGKRVVLKAKVDPSLADFADLGPTLATNSNHGPHWGSESLNTDRDIAWAVLARDVNFVDQADRDGVSGGALWCTPPSRRPRSSKASPPTLPRSRSEQQRDGGFAVGGAPANWTRFRRSTTASASTTFGVPGRRQTRLGHVPEHGRAACGVLSSNLRLPWSRQPLRGGPSREFGAARTPRGRHANAAWAPMGRCSSRIETAANTKPSYAHAMSRSVGVPAPSSVFGMGGVKSGPRRATTRAP